MEQYKFGNDAQKGFRKSIIVRCVSESITRCKERTRKTTNAIVTMKDKKHIFKVFCDVTITKDDLLERIIRHWKKGRRTNFGKYGADISSQQHPPLHLLTSSS